jgi:vancomycin permeability regulator SanA
MKVLKIILYTFISGVIFIGAIILFSVFYIQSFGKNIASSVEETQPQTLALIFGGGMKEDGVTMSEMQEDRVKRGIELYKAGKVQKLRMTGDDGANNSNEVGAMHDYAVKAGVPDEAVDTDPHGYNTYKSCDRAKNVYGVTSTVAISQSFHLPRITYFCSGQGIVVTPVSADLRDYGWWGRLWPAGIREALARVKAVVAGQSESVGNVVVY